MSFSVSLEVPDYKIAHKLLPAEISTKWVYAAMGPRWRGHSVRCMRCRGRYCRGFSIPAGGCAVLHRGAAGRSVCDRHGRQRRHDNGPEARGFRGPGGSGAARDIRLCSRRVPVDRRARDRPELEHGRRSVAAGEDGIPDVPTSAAACRSIDGRCHWQRCRDRCTALERSCPAAACDRCARSLEHDITARRDHLHPGSIGTRAGTVGGCRLFRWCRPIQRCDGGAGDRSSTSESGARDQSRSGKTGQHSLPSSRSSAVDDRF